MFLMIKNHDRGKPKPSIVKNVERLAVWTPSNNSFLALGPLGLYGLNKLDLSFFLIFCGIKEYEHIFLFACCWRWGR